MHEHSNVTFIINKEAKEKFCHLSDDDIKFKNPDNFVSELFHLLPYFRWSGYPYSAQTPTELLRSIHNHAENFIENIFYSVECLGKFLSVGAQDEDVGSIGKDEICTLAHHIKMLGELGSNLLNIKEHARIELANRNVVL